MILTTTNLQYNIKAYIMKPKILFFFFFAFVTISLSSGQKNNIKVTITGIVVDVNQNPVPDAVITINGNKSNIATDRKGFYKIKVKSSTEKVGIFTSSPLVIEEAVNGRMTINFTLDATTVNQIASQHSAPGEEEVNTGYGTAKRKNLTTSIDKIDGTRQKYASYQTIFDMIRGEVPGVQVNGRSIIIRSPSSINLSSEPLFVVDGVPVSSIDDIQPLMVKSIEILKGSAASIYGVRGANGVILITLLTGKDNR